MIQISHLERFDSPLNILMCGKCGNPIDYALKKEAGRMSTFPLLFIPIFHHVSESGNEIIDLVGQENGDGMNASRGNVCHARTHGKISDGSMKNEDQKCI